MKEAGERLVLAGRGVVPLKRSEGLRAVWLKLQDLPPSVARALGVIEDISEEVADLEEETLALVEVRGVVREPQVQGDQIVPSGRAAEEIHERGDRPPMVGHFALDLEVDRPGGQIIAPYPLFEGAKLHENGDLKFQVRGVMGRALQVRRDRLEHVDPLPETPQISAVLLVLGREVEDYHAGPERLDRLREAVLLKVRELPEQEESRVGITGELGLSGVEQGRERREGILRTKQRLQQIEERSTINAGVSRLNGILEQAGHCQARTCVLREIGENPRVQAQSAGAIAKMGPPQLCEAELKLGTFGAPGDGAHAVLKKLRELGPPLTLTEQAVELIHRSWLALVEQKDSTTGLNRVRRGEERALRELREPEQQRDLLGLFRRKRDPAINHLGLRRGVPGPPVQRFDASERGVMIGLEIERLPKLDDGPLGRLHLLVEDACPSKSELQSSSRSEEETFAVELDERLPGVREGREPPELWLMADIAFTLPPSLGEREQSGVWIVELVLFELRDAPECLDSVSDVVEIDERAVEEIAQPSPLSIGLIEGNQDTSGIEPGFRQHEQPLERGAGRFMVRRSGDDRTKRRDRPTHLAELLDEEPAETALKFALLVRIVREPELNLEDLEQVQLPLQMGVKAVELPERFAVVPIEGEHRPIEGDRVIEAIEVSLADGRGTQQNRPLLRGVVAQLRVIGEDGDELRPLSGGVVQPTSSACRSSLFRLSKRLASWKHSDCRSTASAERSIRRSITSMSDSTSPTRSKRLLWTSSASRSSGHSSRMRRL